MNEHESVPHQDDENTEPQLEGQEGFLDPSVEEYHQGLKREIASVDQEAKGLVEGVDTGHERASGAIEALQAMKRSILIAIEKDFDQKILEIVSQQRELVREANKKLNLGHELRSEQSEAK